MKQAMFSAAFIGPFVSERFQINTVKLAVNACLAGTAALIVVMLPGKCFETIRKAPRAE